LIIGALTFYFQRITRKKPEAKSLSDLASSASVPLPPSRPSQSSPNPYTSPGAVTSEGSNSVAPMSTSTAPSMVAANGYYSSETVPRPMSTGNLAAMGVPPGFTPQDYYNQSVYYNQFYPDYQPQYQYSYETGDGPQSAPLPAVPELSSAK
jgi:hypothetical protein